MATTPESTQAAKVRIYRAYQRGEVTEDEVREVLRDDFEEFESFAESMELVSDSVTNEATDDLFC